MTTLMMSESVATSLGSLAQLAGIETLAGVVHCVLLYLVVVFVWHAVSSACVSCPPRPTPNTGHASERGPISHEDTSSSVGRCGHGCMLATPPHTT